IESGFIYSTTLLVEYIIMLTRGATAIMFDPTVISTQFSALAPSLLIVQLAYNKSADSIHQSQKVSTVAFADHSGLQESQAHIQDFHDALVTANKSVC
ncbi:hypothetical protein V5O48_015550, partial [Marasmius crinis-equi]